MKQLSVAQPSLKSFIQDANAKIINYYNEQGDNIIKQAQLLAKAKKYDEALFQLALIPNVCEVPYQKALIAADAIYQKYIDDLAQKNLAKARAIWNAGQNAEAAAEAGQYLAEILPDASCYAQAEALAKEIGARVSSDIDYARNLLATELEREYKTEGARVKAWRDVGVAFGNNQQATTYSPNWIVR